MDEGSAAASIGLLRIDHVGVAVPDLEEAIDFYERVFSMRCVHTEDNVEQGLREAMMAVGSDPTDGCVQLLAPLSPDSTIGKFLRRSGPGIQQVAYAVADIDAATAALRSRGVSPIYPEAQRGTGGSRVNFVHPRDTGGVLVELVEHPPDHKS